MKWALIITFTVLNLVHTTWGQNASGGAATPGGATPPSGGTTAPNPPRSPAAPGASGFPASPASPGLPATPVQPGLPASPTAPGLPGFTNASVSLNASNILGRLTPTNSFASTNGLAGIGITNQFGTNIFPFELQPLLANLQINIEQILPLLTAISSSPGLENILSQAGAISNSLASNPISTSGANLSSSFGGNASTRLGVNAGANLSTPAGGSVSSSAGSSGVNQPAGVVSSAPSAALTPGPPNLSPFPSSASGVANGVAGVGGTAANGSITGNSAQALQAVQILQAELERMLPLLSAFNGDLNSGAGLTQSALTNAPTQTGNNFTGTNGFVAPLNTPNSTNQPPLTPTGRQ